MLTVKRKGCLYDGYISLGIMFIYAHCEEEKLSILRLRVIELFVYLHTVKRKGCLYYSYRVSC